MQFYALYADFLSEFCSKTKIPPKRRNLLRLFAYQPNAAFHMVRIRELVKQGGTLDAVRLAKLVEVINQGMRIARDVQNPLIILHQIQRRLI